LADAPILADAPARTAESPRRDGGAAAAFSPCTGALWPSPAPTGSERLQLVKPVPAPGSGARFRRGERVPPPAIRAIGVRRVRR